MAPQLLRAEIKVEPQTHPSTQHAEQSPRDLDFTCVYAVWGGRGRLMAQSWLHFPGVHTAHSASGSFSSQATSCLVTKLTCQPQRMGTSSLLRGWGAEAAFLPGETLRGPIGVWALGPVRGSGTVSALASPARPTRHMHHMGLCTAGG